MNSDLVTGSTLSPADLVGHLNLIHPAASRCSARRKSLGQGASRKKVAIIIWSRSSPRARRR